MNRKFECAQAVPGVRPRICELRSARRMANTKAHSAICFELLLGWMVMDLASIHHQQQLCSDIHGTSCPIRKVVCYITCYKSTCKIQDLAVLKQYCEGLIDLGAKVGDRYILERYPSPTRLEPLSITSISITIATHINNTRTNNSSECANLPRTQVHSSMHCLVH